MKFRVGSIFLSQAENRIITGCQILSRIWRWIRRRRRRWRRRYRPRSPIRGEAAAGEEGKGMKSPAGKTTPSGTTHDATSDTQGRRDARARVVISFGGFHLLSSRGGGKRTPSCEGYLVNQTYLRMLLMESPHRNINGRQQIRLFLCSCSAL